MDNKPISEVEQLIDQKMLENITKIVEEMTKDYVFDESKHGKVQVKTNISFANPPLSPDAIATMPFEENK